MGPRCEVLEWGGWAQGVLNTVLLYQTAITAYRRRQRRWMRIAEEDDYDPEEEVRLQSCPALKVLILGFHLTVSKTCAQRW